MEIGREKGFLGQILGGGSVMDQLEADGVHQPLVLNHQGRKLFLCHARHAAPPPPFAVRQLYYDAGDRISSKFRKEKFPAPALPLRGRERGRKRLRGLWPAEPWGVGSYISHSDLWASHQAGKAGSFRGEGGAYISSKR